MTDRLVFMLRRLPHLTRDEFQRYWWDRHAPLVAERADVLGIRRYQQVHTVKAARANQGAEFDGIAELWFDGPSSTVGADERRQASADLLADERHFIDHAASPIWLAEERPHWSEAREGLRMTAALRRFPHVTRAEFRRHWHDIHAPLAWEHNDVMGFSHYQQLHTPDDAETFPTALARGAPPPFDGVSEIWRRPVTPTPERDAESRAAITADEAHFLDRSRSMLWLSEVRVVVDR